MVREFCAQVHLMSDLKVDGVRAIARLEKEYGSKYRAPLVKYLESYPWNENCLADWKTKLRDGAFAETRISAHIGELGEPLIPDLRGKNGVHELIKKAVTQISSCIAMTGQGIVDEDLRVEVGLQAAYFGYVSEESWRDSFSVWSLATELSDDFTCKQRVWYPELGWVWKYNYTLIEILAEGRPVLSGRFQGKEVSKAFVDEVRKEEPNLVTDLLQTLFAIQPTFRLACIVWEPKSSSAPI